MRVEGTYIDPKLLKEGRNEEMEYMRKMGVFEVVDEKECDDNSCQTEVGGQDERRKCRSRLVCREIKEPRTEVNNMDQKTYFHPCRRRKG